MLNNIPVPDLNINLVDKTMWKDQNGNLVEFSTKQVWMKLSQQNEEVAWNKVVWFTQGNPRYAFVLWMAIKGRLQTQDRLMIWNSNKDMKCSLCNKTNDSHRHLFFECEFSKRIWEEMKRKMDNSDIPNGWENVIEYYIQSPNNNSIRSVLQRIVLATTV